MKSHLCTLALFVSLLSAAHAAGILGGPITNPANGHIYYLLTADTWTNSELAAATLGGHLATINDAAEDAWVYSTFSSWGGVPRTMWIGLNDAANEGSFVWVSGESSTYSHWGPGEPNNIGDEDFVCYFPPDQQYRETWNDCSWNSIVNGLVEISGATTTNCIPVLAGLVSWWAASDNANDSVGPNHGTLVGGTTFAPGKYGQAFSFDGVDDGVNIPDSPSLQLTQSFTIEAWIYIRAYPVEPLNFWTIGSIVFRGDDRGGLDPYSLLVRGATRKLEFSIISADNQQAYLEAPIPAGEWVHVAATLDDATGAMKLYLNASVVAATNTPLRSLGPLDPASNPGLGIGNVQGAGRSPFRFPFNGLLDNVRIYSRALLQSEIQSIYAPTTGCELALGLRIYAGLTLSAPVGSLVRIEYRNSVGPSDEWRFLTNVAIPATPYIFLDPASSTIPQRFYRAFVLP